jgi:hypothetical protein
MSPTSNLYAGGLILISGSNFTQAAAPSLRVTIVNPNTAAQQVYYLPMTVSSNVLMQATLDIYNQTDGSPVVVDVSFNNFTSIAYSATMVYHQQPPTTAPSSYTPVSSAPITSTLSPVAASGTVAPNNPNATCAVSSPALASFGYTFVYPGTVLPLTGKGFTTPNIVLGGRATVVGSYPIRSYTVTVQILSDNQLNITIPSMSEPSNTQMILEISTDGFNSVIYSSLFTYQVPSQASSNTANFNMANAESVSSSFVPTSSIGSTPTAPLIYNTTTVPVSFDSTSSTDIAPTLPGYTPPTTALVLSSSFSSTSSITRRALRSTGSYTFQNKVAYVQASIDPSTTSGNVIELWMYDNLANFMYASMSISPSGATTIGLIWNATDFDGSALTTTTPCAFKFATWYQYNLELQVPTSSANPTWILQGTLTEMRSGTTVCLVSYVAPYNFDGSAYVENTFKLIISQSANNVNMANSGSVSTSRRTSISTARTTTAMTDTMKVYLDQAGVTCAASACSSPPVYQAPTPTPAPGTPVSSNSIVIGSFVGVGVLLVVVLVLVAAIIVIARKNYKRKAYIYDSGTPSTAGEPHNEEDQSDQQLNDPRIDRVQYNIAWNNEDITSHVRPQSQ